MSPVGTEPIRQHWTTIDPVGSVEPVESWDADPPAATVADVAVHLGLLEIDDIDAELTALVAAAAAEVAHATGIVWSRDSDDAPVALLRLIAKVTIRNPTAGGPHTARLLDRLA
jgi:hypothetical protein